MGPAKKPEWLISLEHGLEESQNQRDARVEKLWARLDPTGKGELDLNGLQKGFSRIDHPMKNANEMVKRILERLDTNKDGKIQYDEFRAFIEHAELQLLMLFRSIDCDKNGRLDRSEIQEAFKRAGLTVPLRKLNAFFDDMDTNNDGFVSFDEWRDFLMFMPIQDGSPLQAVMSWYSSIVTVTAEGDSVVSDETLKGLGKKRRDPRSARQKGLTSFIPDPGYFLAGAIAGGVSRTATAPLDRLKVYLLVNTQSGASATSEAATQGRFLAALRNSLRPIAGAVREIHASGGARGFFAGNGLNVIKIMPETAIKFGSYEATKRAFANLEGHGDPKKISPYSKFAAGGIAGMVAQFAVYPLDTLKFRLQCETVKGGLTGNALLAATAKKMMADGGVRSAYRGVTMGLVGMFPYSAIDMGMFEFLKNLYRQYNARWKGIHEEDAGPGNIATGIIGATSGAIGATAVYPLNVVRTRLQTQGTVMHKEVYTGIWDVTQRTIKNEGIRGLYKGLTPNLLKVAPALSITWVVYENAKKVLGLD